MSPFWGTPPKADNPYYTAMNEAIGVDVTWQNQDGVTYDQKLGAVLAGSDIPDVVAVPGWNMMGRIPSAINAKFADLGPYLSGDKVRDYPNLAAVPTEAWQRGIFGGQLRAVPMPASYVTDIAPMYRKDLFEEKGYSVPKTPDEFLSWAKEATDAKSKVWACDDMKWASCNIFGVLSGSDKALWWNMEDGKLINRIETERVPRSAGVDAQALRGRGGPPGRRCPARRAATPGTGSRPVSPWSTTANISGWWGKVSEQATQNPDFDIAAFDYFGPDGGDPTLWAVQPANIFTFVSKKATEAQIKDFLALCNFCAAPYGTKEFMLTAYGVEGTDYDDQEGPAGQDDPGRQRGQRRLRLHRQPRPVRRLPRLPRGHQGHGRVAAAHGRLHQEVLLLRPVRHRAQPLGQPRRRLRAAEDDVVRGRKKISDVQQAVSEWKSKGGDDLRDWYKKLLDDNGSAN